MWYFTIRDFLALLSVPWNNVVSIQGFFCFSRLFGLRQSSPTSSWPSCAEKPWHWMEPWMDSNSCSRPTGKSWRLANAGSMEALKSSSLMELELEHFWLWDLTTSFITMLSVMPWWSVVSTPSLPSFLPPSFSPSWDSWLKKKEWKSAMWLNKVLDWLFLSTPK